MNASQTTEAESAPGTSPDPATVVAGLDLSVRTKERTDDRRNKVYERTVQIRTELPYKGGRTLNVRNVGERLCLALDQYSATDYFPTEQRIGRVRAHGHTIGHDAVVACSWTLRLIAKKPSEIVSEEEADAWARMHVLPLLRVALAAEYAEYAEEKRRDEAARQANQIGRWAAKTTMAAAKEAVRYEQRLAALRAELEAELNVQARKLVSDGAFDEAVEKHQADPGQTTFEPEAIAYAREHFPEMHTGWDQPFHDETRWFRGNLFPETQEATNE